MFVTKEYRGGSFGVFNELLKHACSMSRIEGIHHVYLGTMSQFKSVHRFYEKKWI